MSRTARVSRAARTVLAIVAVVFATELAVMFGLRSWLGEAWQPRLALLDALLLALVIAPPIYLLVLRPLSREAERRLKAEFRAREAGRLAMTDPLTGVLNRRGIKAALLEAMAHGERYGRPLSVAMMDLDGFKQVNDRHGHAVGDRTLSQVVRRVERGLRGPDRLGRIGGDEFLMVLPETRLPAARILTARVAYLLRNRPIEVAGVRLRLTASIGTEEFRQDEDLEELLARVDEALYQAKRDRVEPSNGKTPNEAAEGGSRR